MYESTAVLKLQENREQENKIQEAEQALIEELEKELGACEGVTNIGKKRVLEFMVREKIWHITDLGYEERKKFIEYITERYEKSRCQVYKQTFDQIKKQTLSRPSVLPVGMKIWVPPYKPGLFYLPYHPDERLREMVKGLRQTDALLWDFTINASEKVKEQVYKIIHYILMSDILKSTKRRNLVALSLYYQFCVKHGIEDLELVESHEVKLFYATLKSESEFNRSSPIVGICRRELFIHASEVNWEAHVWYMERFRFQTNRLDPANPVEKLSFVKIEHAANRKLIKEYFQYSLGATSIALSHLRIELEYLRDFMNGIKQNNTEDVRTISAEQINSYFQALSDTKEAAETFNARIMSIYHFFCFLQARHYVEKPPFRPEYYRRKVVTRHNDRCVLAETVVEITQKLYLLPEDRRMMYLHLWCLGLRISEVCTLKGDAYSEQNGDTWIQVYQVKMREYKRIPIPRALYELMQVYLKRHKVGAKEYIFKSLNGGAYRSNSFNAQMRTFCRENHIQNGEYLFRSHDFRHNVATEYFDKGISLQGIRDYLGHKHEEMTRQYIDFMPKRIEAENDKFFEQHSLASCIRKENRISE